MSLRANLDRAKRSAVARNEPISCSAFKLYYPSELFGWLLHWFHDFGRDNLDAQQLSQAQSNLRLLKQTGAIVRQEAI